MEKTIKVSNEQFMAVEEGFEPSVIKNYTVLAGQPFKPTQAFYQVIHHIFIFIWCILLKNNVKMFDTNVIMFLIIQFSDFLSQSRYNIHKL